MIDLTATNVQTASPRMLHWGSAQTPPLGGVTQQLDRIGTRYALEVYAPPMDIEPDGRRWISRLQQAKQEGARFCFPQVEFTVGAPGSPVVAADVAGGKSLPITGGTRGYAIREGQWLSITHGARSYLYAATANVFLDQAGAAIVPLSVPLRTKLTAGDWVNLTAPIIEGTLEGDALEWTLDAARTVGLSFAIVERA